jgi:hypothetical protein
MVIECLARLQIDLLAANVWAFRLVVVVAMPEVSSARTLIWKPERRRNILHSFVMHYSASEHASRCSRIVAALCLSQVQQTSPRNCYPSGARLSAHDLPHAPSLHVSPAVVPGLNQIQIFRTLTPFLGYGAWLESAFVEDQITLSSNPQRRLGQASGR